MTNQPFRKLAVAALAMALSFAVSAADPPKQPEMTPEQQAMMAAFAKMAEVRAEHKQLDYFTGRWTTKMTMVMDPAAPPETSTGKVEYKPLFEGRSYEMFYEGSFAGSPMTGRGLIGFDNLKGKYFSTWMDSTSTGIWLAYGSYDASTKSYTFHGEMNDPMHPDQMLKIRQVTRVVDADHYVFEWYDTHEGKEVKSMWIEYTRVK